MTLSQAACFIGLKIALSADTICGEVKDDIAGLPMIGAVVQISSTSDKSVVATTLTDYQGKFQVKALPPGSYTVCASFPGYQTSSYLLDTPSDSRVIIVLREAVTINGDTKDGGYRNRRKAQRRQASVETSYSVGVVHHREPADEAASMTKKMRGRLRLSPEQEIIFSLVNQNYISRVIELQSNRGDTALRTKIYQTRKARNKRLEEVLTESQYDQWIRLTQHE